MLYTLLRIFFNTALLIWAGVVLLMFFAREGPAASGAQTRRVEITTPQGDRKTCIIWQSEEMRMPFGSGPVYGFTTLGCWPS
jgi:hypothetical protein